jgi:hypothetical protein
MTFPNGDLKVKRLFHAVVLAFLAALCLVLTAKAQSTASFDTRNSPVSEDGTRAVVDLPASQHMRNTGGSDGPRGPGSGSGLCVFTSIEHAARWQNIAAITGLQKWMTYRPGGGYPSKVDAMLKAFCDSKGIAVPVYIQHEGGEVDFLELALKTDRIVCVTYDGRDGFYGGSVGHMVNLAYLDSTRAAIIDNNRPGKWVWMTRAEFLSRWINNGGGWAIVFLANPPPPYAVQPAHDWPVSEAVDVPDTIYEQCVNGVCPRPLSPLAVPIEAKADGWHKADFGGEQRFEYFHGGKFVGQWESDGWHPATATGGVYVKPEPLPPGLHQPAVGPIATTSEIPTGVVPNHVGKARRYTVKGKEVPRHIAFASLASGDLADDSSRWHLTAVGDAAFLAKVKADIEALPNELQSRLLFQGYSPTDWPVAQFSLPAGLSLRKPSPVRVGADIGQVTASDYAPGKLVWLLSQIGGPLPPIIPVPLPMEPTDPVQPRVDPILAPGLVIPYHWLAAAGIAIAVWVTLRIFSK